MNELLKINYEAEQPTVSARDLHEALEINTRFNDWFSRMAEYGFENGVDFNLLKNEKVRLEGFSDPRKASSTVNTSLTWKKPGTPRSRSSPAP